MSTRAISYIRVSGKDQVRRDGFPRQRKAIADYAALINERSDDIGARRLHTVMEKMLEEVSFDAPDLGRVPITIDEKFVRERLEELVQDEDLSRFIL